MTEGEEGGRRRRRWQNEKRVTEGEEGDRRRRGW